MIKLHKLYQAQYNKAKETLEILEKQRADINLKLEKDPISAVLHKELRTVNLEIKITLNEIEQAEEDIAKAEATISTF